MIVVKSESSSVDIQMLEYTCGAQPIKCRFKCLPLTATYYAHLLQTDTLSNVFNVFLVVSV